LSDGELLSQISDPLLIRVKFVLLSLQMRLEHFNLILELVDLLRLSERIQHWLYVFLLFDNQWRLLFHFFIGCYNRLVNHLLFFDDLLLFLLNLQVEFKILGDGASQFDDNRFECFDFALLDVDLGFGLF